MINTIGDDIYGYLIYFSQWLLPVVMIFLYNYRTIKFNDIYKLFYKYFLVCSFAYIFFLFIRPSEPLLFYLLIHFHTTYLMIFYGLICLAFTYYLINSRSWDFPQAFAVSYICVSIGTFFWEVPTVIYNLFTKGYEVDIFLQLFAIIFFFYILITCGWRSDRKALLSVLLGIIISVIFLYFRSPLPPSIGDDLSYYWNSPYFMINRFINTVIVLYCVNKSKPMEKSKKNVDNKNPT